MGAWRANDENILEVSKENAKELIRGNVLETTSFDDDYFFFNFLYVHFKDSEIFLNDGNSIVTGAYFSNVIKDTLTINFVTKNSNLNYENPIGQEDILFLEKSLFLAIHPDLSGFDTTIKSGLDNWLEEIEEEFMREDHPNIINDGWDEVIEDLLKITIGAIKIQNTQSHSIEMGFTDDCPNDLVLKYYDCIDIILSEKYSEQEIAKAHDRMNQILDEMYELGHYRLSRLKYVDNEWF